MGKQKPTESRQLRTLERWRAAELESAQTRYVALSKVTLEKQAAHERISTGIADLQVFARDALGRAVLSVDTLHRLTAFSAVQARDLHMAQTALEESQAKAEEAREQVMQQFEHVSVVKRLLERRAAEAVKDTTREAQRQLDEHALTQCSARVGSEDTGQHEE